ncbi:polysaccharide pyruvyl transferase family protein [Bordetella genomosp. 9]|nr:polysaccharide pyruvyl transferase family protein [Bordetella genomosp. 9]
MKYGYLEFRYGNDANRTSVNIGDNIQSLATRALFGRLGIAPEDMVGIDRDALRDYAGEPVRLIMNGCFHDGCFPLPPQVEPVFFGFNAETESVVTRNRELLLRHQPIGCRDAVTRRMLEKHGIAAFVTGCVTMTLPRRDAAPADGVPVIAYGSGPGALPAVVLQAMPKPMLESARLIYQREPISCTPLADGDVARMEGLAARYLDFYRRHARLVVTPLLHVASPCLGMGVPVVLIRRDRNARFTAIDRLTPLYTPEDARRIDWDAGALELEELKGAMTSSAGALLAGRSPDPRALAVLAQAFDQDPILEPAPRSFKRRLRDLLRGGRLMPA